MTTPVFYVGNTSPAYTDVIRSAGVPVALPSGTAVKFRMRSTVTPDVLKVDADAVVDDGPTGRVHYDWAAGDLDTAGDYYTWWHITWPGGRTQDSASSLLVVSDPTKLDSPDELLTLADLRQDLSIDENDRSGNERARDLIRDVTAAIKDYCGAEFTPRSTGLTRTFVWDGYGAAVHLAPYSLRGATAISLDADTPSPVTLVASTDYWYDLDPDGVTQYIEMGLYRLPRYLPRKRRIVAVTGDWGYPQVPQLVRRAALVTAKAWYSPGAAQISIAPEGATAGAGATPVYDIPYAAQRLLTNWKPSGVA